MIKIPCLQVVTLAEMYLVQVLNLIGETVRLLYDGTIFSTVNLKPAPNTSRPK